MSKIAFSTTAYEIAHNRKPRGRGTWAFCPERLRTSKDALANTLFVPGLKTLAEAKVVAREHFDAKGEGYVAVCP
jgi:hypothetical protein